MEHTVVMFNNNPDTYKSSCILNSQLDENLKETLINLVNEGAFDRINAIGPKELKDILNLAEYKENAV